MGPKDRERLAASTVIALGGYVVIFLLMTGLHWPPNGTFRKIPSPAAVYVNLVGPSAAAPKPALAVSRPAAPTAPPPQPVPAAIPRETAPAKQATVVAPQHPESTPNSVSTQTENTPAVAPPAGASQSAPASTAASSEGGQQATAPPAVAPTGPPIPQYETATPITSPLASSRTPQAPTTNGQANGSGVAGTGGTTGSESAAAGFQSSASNGTSQGVTSTLSAGSQNGPVSGPSSPKPGVDYSPINQSAPAPPSGSGGAASQNEQSQSQTFYGPQTPSVGGFLNPGLSTAAGGSGTAGEQAGGGQTGGPGNAGGASSGSSATGSQSAGSGLAGTAGQGGTSGASAAGAATSQSGGPKIEWKGASSARMVVFEPGPLVIPKQYLGEIPPTITLHISFEVTPLGTVNTLHITPSLGYPQLDNALEAWMEEWRFQPIDGNQVAQGTLQYVIQATTAK